MKKFRIIATVVIVIAMCMLMTIPVLAQNDLGVTYSAALDNPTLNVSSEAQTVVLTIKADSEITLDSITAQAKVPEGLTLKAIANAELGFTGAHYNLNNGMISWFWDYSDGNDNATTDLLATVTYTVPANTPAGTYIIDFDIKLISSDWGTQWEYGETLTTTLTIKEAGCEHEYEYDCSKNCKLCGEETRPEADHAYTYACDKNCKYCGEETRPEADHTGGTATCTEKATCSACGEKYGLEADHSFLNGIRGTQLTPGNCNYSAEYATKCDNCDYEDETKVISGEKDPSVHYLDGTLGYYKNNGDGTHSFICGPCGQPTGVTGEHDKNGAVSQPGNCLYPSVIACSVCKADITYTTVPDVHPNGVVTVCDDNKDGKTHTVKWPCCGDVVDAKAAHDYTTGTSAHTCSCGAVETFKLTVLDGMLETVIDKFDVPYNNNLMTYLSQLTPADIPYAGAGDPNGYCSFSGDYWYAGYNGQVNTDDSMPGEDIVILAYYEYTGWAYCGEIDGVEQYQYNIKDEVLTGWQYIEGSWYYLNPDYVEGYDGLRVYGLTRVPYPTEAINGVTYAPNADDKAYWEAHKDTSKYSDATTALFYFDEDGKFVQYTGLEGKSYFINGMAPWHVGFVQIGEDFYYFGGDKVNGGNVMLTGKVYATRDYNSGKAVGTDKIYYFAEDGKLIEGNEGIVEMADGYYYFVGGKLAYGAGVVKMTDDEGKTFYIYVKSNGQLATGIYWPTTLNGELERGAYNWGTDGKYYPDVQEEEIREVDGVYYYYVNGIKKPGAGVVKMTDAEGATFYIYVRSNGQLATGEYWPTTLNGLLPRGKYDWGEDGKYYPDAE